MGYAERCKTDGAGRSRARNSRGLPRRERQASAPQPPVRVRSHARRRSQLRAPRRVVFGVDDQVQGCDAVRGRAGRWRVVAARARSVEEDVHPDDGADDKDHRVMDASRGAPRSRRRSRRSQRLHPQSPTLGTGGRFNGERDLRSHDTKRPDRQHRQGSRDMATLRARAQRRRAPSNSPSRASSQANTALRLKSCQTAACPPSRPAWKTPERGWRPNHQPKVVPARRQPHRDRHRGVIPLCTTSVPARLKRGGRSTLRQQPSPSFSPRTPPGDRGNYVNASTRPQHS